MALNPEFAGRTYPASAPYQVCREKIREFATALGDMNPAYHDVGAARALGHADLVAPPTFPFVLTMKAMAVAMFDPELGLDYSRVVHGEQRHAFVRPVVAGETLVVHSTIEAVRTVAGNDLLTFRGDLTTEDGDPVVSAWSVIVSRGTASPESAQEG